jgi:hypothetical protein
MGTVKYGRKTYSFIKGTTLHTCTAICEKPLPHEDEVTFTSRLMKKYEDRKGTVELVFKKGQLDYAVVKLPCHNTIK